MADLLNPLRVIMVDDDQVDIYLTNALCKRSNLSIDFLGLNSSQALLDYIDKNGTSSVDVILVDMNMHIKNGYELVQELKTFDGLEDVTVVIFSTHEHLAKNLLAFKDEGIDFVTKPFSKKDARNFVNLLTLYHAHHHAPQH